jgi:hypothetical protein
VTPERSLRDVLLPHFDLMVARAQVNIYEINNPMELVQ